MNSEFLQKNRKNLIIAGVIFFSYIGLHLIFQRHEQLAYDMYAYTSFADHYAENWFYTIIPEQAHGLEIVSYPPLLFQVMAALSFIPLINQTSIYIILMSAGVTALSFSFYELIRTLLGFKDEYRPVILLIGFSPGLLKFSLVHGQLPLIIGMIFGSLSSIFFYRAVKGFETRTKLAVSLLLTGYIHHFSLLITIIIITCISLLHFKDAVSRIEYLIPPIGFSALLVLIGLFPMIRESFFGISQGVIAHGSRHPLETLRIFNQFVTTTYGITVAGLLVILKKKKNYHSVNILALVFLTIGIGLATPTPEILFGNMSTFLVYDKFALISSFFLTGILGFYVLENNLSWKDKEITRYLFLAFILISLVTVFWANRIHLGSYTGYGKHDINQTNTAIDYLNENASDKYLYQTAGHNTPVEEIRRQTDIPTLDTAYFQGRKHGILEDEGKFDRLNPAKFKKVVENADNVSLKYVLIFRKRYNGIFSSTDWEKNYLENGVIVWINPEAPEYEPELGQRRLIFGTMPLIIFSLSLVLILSDLARKKMRNLFDHISSMIKNVSNWENRSRLWIFVFPLIAASPSFLTSGYPAGIDTPAHIFKPTLMAHMIENYGQVFHWTNQWYNGYPFLSMYPPISTKLIYYTELLIGNITISYNLVRLLSIASLSGVIYLLSANVTNDQRVRIMSSALVVFSYPLYSNLYTVGRLASALALPIYIFIVHLLLREDIFQKEISRGHLMIGLTASSLFLMHSMMAYLFIFTGLIFCWVYREKVAQIGYKPVIFALGLPLLIALPYLGRLLQHFSITDPSWYVEAQEFNIFKHLKPSYSIVPPTYTGLIHTVFFSLGILGTKGKLKDRFFKFSITNFLFFFTAYWARNYRVAYFIPLSKQFDLARFGILFVVFGILIAAYGLKFVFNGYLSDISNGKKNVLAGILIIIVILQSAPMFVQSANWEPEFKDEIKEVDLEEGYRSIGLDMRQWHTYFFWEMETMNTFGWFNQANPNPSFTQSLQRSGGRWRGWDFVQDIDDNNFRNNLLELSNTKYIVSPQGDWMKGSLKQQVKGTDPHNHPLNKELAEEIKKSEKFSLKSSSKHLKIYEFNRNMSYCEGIRPVWIDNNYNRKARDLLREPRMLPKVPVKGEKSTKNRTAEGIKCSKEDPYTISIEVEKGGWVLVKESYYPFWDRLNEKDIHSGFGFMVTYVEEEGKLKYKPRDLSTLQINDIKSLY